MATLSSRVLPRRVRTLLEGIFELVADEIDRGLTATLDGLEQQLFKLADQVRSNDLQLRCLEALGTVKHGRFDLMPRFVALLESGLAMVREPDQHDVATMQAISYNDLELVAEADLDETTLLHEIAARADSKVSLPLFLLSQRFGVIAGKPALDTAVLPVGPAQLCRHLRRASQCFELLPEHRQLLFRQFERHVLLGYPSLIDRINAYLVHQGVLPHLTYVPPRHKAGARPEETTPAPPQHADDRNRTGGRATSPAHVAAESGMSRPSAFTGWPGDAIGIPVALPQRRAEDAIYTNLRDMLHNARGVPPAGASARPQGPGAVSTSDVQSVLGLLQRRPQAAISVNGQMRPPNVTHIKQDLLAQLRQVTGAEVAPVLASEDTDTIDLVGMLFDQIMKDVRPNSTAAHLLSRLQVPLLRVALSDKAFFSQQEHPARQMLDAVAETGAYWAGEDAADRELIGNVERLVERISQEFDGDIGLFNTLLSELAGQTQTVMRRAELAERRHVEAAQGREKLAVAQAHATRIMHEITTAHPVPKFTRTLLTQAWTDVLALTALRHGEDSDEWRHQVETANQIATMASITASDDDAEHGLPEDPEQAAALSEHVERSLMQVGYHAEEAAAIGQRVGSGEAESDDNTSRTELAMKMKTRGRLGDAATAAADEVELPALTAHEQRCLERIRDLPFGTWLEFITNQQGDSVRRRLSWFSPITGHCLFINHRGQKIGDHTLDSLARAMARNQVRIVEPKRESLLDRALHRVRDLLRSPADATHETGAKA
ncbi:MAG: DUF1631 domain-containing protein [Proteobacteria bacterium]|nr:DUF1631 domain-containing protein [Pseudomonadota bacterium]